MKYANKKNVPRKKSQVPPKKVRCNKCAKQVTDTTAAKKKHRSRGCKQSFMNKRKNVVRGRPPTVNQETKSAQHA